MGGVHAGMTAGLYSGDLACAPLLAPRSAAVAYVDGAMHAAMAWDAVKGELDGKNRSVQQVRGVFCTFGGGPHRMASRSSGWQRHQ
jgi:hypothetical protein